MHFIIVIPCYNEELRLDVQSFANYEVEEHRHQFLFVDDGSSDKTPQILRELEQRNPERIKVLSLSPNRGKAEAVRAGLLAALQEEPDFIGFWDADLATPLSEIQHFSEIISIRPAVDILFGARVKLLGREVQRQPLRHYLGRIFATAVSIVLGLPIYDTQCGAKLLRVNSITREILNAPFRAGWIFDVEMLARYENAYEKRGESITDKVYEVPLMIWKDVKGSKLKPKDFIKAVFSLAWIYFHYFVGRSKKKK